MIYVLFIFHSAIKERKKIRQNRMERLLRLNMSDYSISYQLISMYLKKDMESADEELH